jgi:methylated-DNA-[protein]-cysteine S-methyltransferase
MLDVNLGLIEFTILNSPMGSILLVAKNDRLIELDLSQKEGSAVRKALLKRYPHASESAKPFTKLQPLLDTYLQGRKVAFDVPFDLLNMADFSRRVLLLVKDIPYGTLTSYGALGKLLGYPSAARAVGQAVGRNPIPIVIPCHRVVRSDGTLGGFSMGLSLKEQLLTLEGVKPMQAGSPAEKPLYALSRLV